MHHVTTRRRRRPALALLLLGGLALPTAAQADFSAVEVKATPVAGAVSMITGLGGNIGVSAGPDGILIVDDQFAELSDRIKARLDELAGGGTRIVINTRYHADHTGGNASFSDTATIVAHHTVRERLAKGREHSEFPQPPAPREALPSITFQAELLVHWNDELIRELHRQSGDDQGSQAHTDGDSIVWFTGSNVAHLGDLFFAGRYPFVDLDSGGSLDGLKETIKYAIQILPDDVKIIPGHGPISTMDDLILYQRMLNETSTWVRRKMGAGRKLEQLLEDGLPDEWNGWGDGFINEEQWITMIYRSYAPPGGGTR
ncbi:MAG: MBL fold metallo-hydrolase [Planctomycetota bacterium]|jgi:glyoxylase-like metal-dependent hydrolase (beta-lactamase superfamily II)